MVWCVGVYWWLAVGGWRDEDPRGKTKTGRGRSERLLDALVAELSMYQRCGRVRVTTSLSETERIRRGVERTVRRNGGRVMRSNEGAAPQHASKEENNNNSSEEEGSWASDLFLCDDEVDGIQSGARVLIVYWRSWQ
jgi:hypothetical protein